MPRRAIEHSVSVCNKCGYNFALTRSSGYSAYALASTLYIVFHFKALYIIEYMILTTEGLGHPQLGVK